MILLDQRQCEIHACGDARRRVDVAVTHENRILVYGDARVSLGELSAELPVRGRAPAVEEPSLGEEERAAAHRSEAPHAPRHASEPGEEQLVLHCSDGAGTAGHEQGVDAAPHLADGAVCEKPNYRRGRDRSRTPCDHLYRVRVLVPLGRFEELARRLTEHFERTRDVEHLDARKRDERDMARRGSSHARSGSQMDSRRACSASKARRTSSITWAGALRGEPASKGGCGSYSRASWMPRATSSPATRAASRNAMSIPEDTPAAVITLPCSTTRSRVGSAPNSRRRSRNIQWLVARKPFRTPAAPRISDPVQTDVVHC